MAVPSLSRPPNEVGAPLVFGRVQPVTYPGWNWNWPYPVGEVLKPAVTDIYAEDVGVGNQMEESLMLTGDRLPAPIALRWGLVDEISRPRARQAP